MTFGRLRRVDIGVENTTEVVEAGEQLVVCDVGRKIFEKQGAVELLIGHIGGDSSEFRRVPLITRGLFRVTERCVLCVTQDSRRTVVPSRHVRRAES